MFNPYFKNTYWFIGYLTIWLIIIILQFILLTVSADISITYTIVDTVIFNILFALIGLSLWFPVKFISFEHNSPIRILINHTVGALTVSAIWVGLSYFFVSYSISLTYNESNFLYSSLFVRYIIGVLYYIIIVTVNYMIIYYNNFKDRLLKEAELQSLVKEAELRSLKYQINPHFIFNSLNSISSLTITDPTKAQEMTIKLSTFIRSTLSKTDTQLTKLSDELKNVKLYLEIEKIRFEGKFNYLENVDKTCCDLLVPNMLLQPVFENAIKHGVYESLDVVDIITNCTKEDDYIKIIVQNNYDKDSVPRKGEGIGLKNIKNRLELMYKQTNLLTINKTESLFTVTIFIPLKVN